MQGLMTVAARLRDGSVRASKVAPSAAPLHLRCLRLAEGDEVLLNAFLDRGRSCPVEPSNSGLLAIDLVTCTIWQLSDFSPLDSQLLAQLAWSFQRDVNKLETASADEMARAGRIRRAFRRREAETRRVTFRTERQPLSHADFLSVVSDHGSARMRPDANGETACISYDLSPMILRTAPLKEQGAAATREAMAEAGFETAGRGWSMSGLRAD